MTDKEIITCQKSQIEDLKEALEERIQRIKVLEAEFERIEKLRAEASKEVERQYEQAEADILANMADGGASCHWCINKHRTAAIREFAERLKTYFITPAQTRIDTEIVELIETLVKEMTEGTNNDGK